MSTTTIEKNYFTISLGEYLLLKRNFEFEIINLFPEMENQFKSMNLKNDLDNESNVRLFLHSDVNDFVQSFRKIKSTIDQDEYLEMKKKSNDAANDLLKDYKKAPLKNTSIDEKIIEKVNDIPEKVENNNDVKVNKKLNDEYYYYENSITDHFVIIYDSMRFSQAYKNLTHVAKLILFDMIRFYNKSIGTSKIKNIYFNYSYSVCDEKDGISKDSFDRAVKMIVDNKFFIRENLENKYNPKTGKFPVRRFHPSNDWKLIK